MTTRADHLQWFESFRASPSFAQFQERPIAYFCAEFALDSSLPTYSGGLGVLAGDVVREAADRGLPMVAVGLFYTKGYICRLHEDGDRFVEVCELVSPESHGLEPVVDESGTRVIVSVPVQDRELRIQAFRKMVGSVPVYFLDTNVEGNTESDRAITDRLYVGVKQTRLLQEVVLGIGGLRMLEALRIHPSIYHLNEGHSALLTLELMWHEMRERSIGFDEAKQFARRRVVFTNHTLVPAGNEIYDNDLVALTLTTYARQLGVPIDALVSLGLVHESSSFSLTMLSLRMASIANGVSRLHALKAKDVWSSHPMVGVTNGVHIGMWSDLDGDLSGPGELWTAHNVQKQRALDVIANRTGVRWSVDDLLIGWARRIADYKRPLSTLEHIDRFAAIARTQGRPLRLVLSGQPHPNDVNGLALLSEIRRITEQLPDIAVYVPDYNLHTARALVAGCDVWLNTPILGYEASGTSGMKAALNGVLPCSTQDGWVAEIDLYGIGWSLDSDRVSTHLLDVLEGDIVPMYYDRGPDGIPSVWERHMRAARQMVLDRFSATRMLREYVELLYR